MFYLMMYLKECAAGYHRHSREYGKPAYAFIYLIRTNTYGARLSVRRDFTSLSRQYLNGPHE